MLGRLQADGPSLAEPADGVLVPAAGGRVA